MQKDLEEEKYKQDSNKEIVLSNKLDFSHLNIDKERQEFYQQRYTRAVADYKIIDKLAEKIADKEMVSVVQDLQLIGVNILFFMNKQPTAVAAAGNFIDYCQADLAKFVQEFCQLSIILDENKKKAKESKIKQTARQMLKLYANFYDELVNSKFLDLDISLKVMQQSIDELALKPIAINKAALKKNIVLTKDVLVGENNNKEKRKYSSMPFRIKLTKIPREIVLLGIEYILFIVCWLAFFLYK
ncbi:hypothetical protein [Pectinatus brassicae]|uniref:Transmembrane protein n=1 Tax=Pectinatus brassicae TaxID=862415 RepID=A0A840UVQ7_9FIRM|nr:hypothetical protein [Pectinatus brassicae]MBB5336525.1 hypothetical protein [Pectinatus brassicae]